MAKKKSRVRKYLNKVERKAKTRVKRGTKRAAKKTGKAAWKGTKKAARATGRGAQRSARAAYNAARVKPKTIVKDMRKAGWSPQQIYWRTGASPSQQNRMLNDKTSGEKYIWALKEARKTAKKGPPDGWINLVGDAPADTWGKINKIEDAQKAHLEKQQNAKIERERKAAEKAGQDAEKARQKAEDAKRRAKDKREKQAAEREIRRVQKLSKEQGRPVAYYAMKNEEGKWVIKQDHEKTLKLRNEADSKPEKEPQVTGWSQYIDKTQENSEGETMPTDDDQIVFEGGDTITDTTGGSHLGNRITQINVTPQQQES